MGVWKNKSTEFNGVTHIRKDNLANNLLYGKKFLITAVRHTYNREKKNFMTT